MSDDNLYEQLKDALEEGDRLDQQVQAWRTLSGFLGVLCALLMLLLIAMNA